LIDGQKQKKTVFEETGPSNKRTPSQENFTKGGEKRALWGGNVVETPAWESHTISPWKGGDFVRKKRDTLALSRGEGRGMPGKGQISNLTIGLERGVSGPGKGRDHSGSFYNFSRESWEESRTI